jgi:propanediol dehydratase large subunit
MDAGPDQPDQPGGPGGQPRRLGRFIGLDARPVNLDGFAERDDEAGLVAFASANDPEPSVALDADGRVTELDGTAAPDFDLIDAFIAARGLDAEVTEEANALSDVAFARLMVDPNVPRAEVVRLAAGATPEKLARVVALLRPVELQMAVSKLRVRKTPSNQAHVTNRLDDPLLLAADAATAVAYGFREVETTVPVNADAASNALAVLIGSQVGAGGALTQCSIEEALELELGLRGLTTYAETVSLYGTEKVFIDGDDTPWSKAFLCSAYASRGLKMRVTSGGGAEALMGAADGRSMFSLESRCVALARAMGAQGVQNGGIDGASVVGCVPDGMRELLAENLLVMLRDLESCSGNDALVSESDMRRTAHTVPLFLAGSDFIFSGFGAIQRYDNMFGPSNFNAEDLDDYLVLQRDWGVDGALRPVTEDQLRAVRERAARACLAVYRELGLADFTDDHVTEVVHAEGSKDVTPPEPQAILAASDAIMERQLGILDVVRALWATGYEQEAGRVLAMGRARVAGDYLQTAAIFDEQMNCLSNVTDPNDYQGPGTGYEVPAARREQIAAIRQQRSRAGLLARHAAGHAAGPRVAGSPRTEDDTATPEGSVPASTGTIGGVTRGDTDGVTDGITHGVTDGVTHDATRQRAPLDPPGAADPASVSRLVSRGPAQPGADPREVCIGVSPALGTKLWFTMSGLPVGEVLEQIVAGIESEGCSARIVRVPSTVDLGVIGLTAAELAGSGVAVGLQAKGTALIHRKGLAPLACLELLSIAPLLTAEMYRELGVNAGRHAQGRRPAPVRNPYTDQAIEARYHAEVVALIAIERGESVPGAPPVDLEVER